MNKVIIIKKGMKELALEEVGINNKYMQILYINSVSLSVCPSVCRGPETQITFNKIVPPNSRAQKLFRTSSSYFYFYVRFRPATAVVNGGGIFGIWRVGEEIWVRFGGDRQGALCIGFTLVNIKHDFYYIDSFEFKFNLIWFNGFELKTKSKIKSINIIS